VNTKLFPQQQQQNYNILCTTKGYMVEEEGAGMKIPLIKSGYRVRGPKRKSPLYSCFTALYQWISLAAKE